MTAKAKGGTPQGEAQPATAEEILHRESCYRTRSRYGALRSEAPVPRATARESERTGDAVPEETEAEVGEKPRRAEPLYSFGFCCRHETISLQ